MDATASLITGVSIVYLTVFLKYRSKKPLKLRVTGLCERNSLVTDEFPAQRASNVENVSIWWRHHVPIHPSDLFRIDPSSGKIYTTQSMAGHSSPSPYQLRVKATNPMDGRQSNSTSVTIWVLSPSPGSGSLGPMFLSPSPSNPEVQILEVGSIHQGALLLTWINFNPVMDN